MQDIYCVVLSLTDNNVKTLKDWIKASHFACLSLTFTPWYFIQNIYLERTPNDQASSYEFAQPCPSQISSSQVFKSQVMFNPG